MSTTAKYNFNFLIPVPLTDTPIAFQIFAKVDEEGNPTGEYYTYNEYMALDGNQAFYANKTTTQVDKEGNETQVPTHAILSINITSTKLREQMEAMLAKTPFQIFDGDDVGNWQDENQTFYVWILTTDPTAVGYNYNAFTEGSPLFNLPTEEMEKIDELPKDRR